MEQNNIEASVYGVRSSTSFPVLNSCCDMSRVNMNEDKHSAGEEGSSFSK
jgi:hypothetical protein